MGAIQFKAGPQVAGTEVIDINGVHWTVLKNIGYASAQPREGAYYTKVVAPTAPAFDYKAAYEKLAADLAILKKNENVVILIDANFHPDDFYIQEVLVSGVKKQLLRIKPKS